MSESDTDHCPACGLEADAMGVLDTGETIYLHDSRYCLHDPNDTGLLGPAVDQLEAHKKRVVEAVDPSITDTDRQEVEQ